jgi:hypothetical protein
MGPRSKSSQHLMLDSLWLKTNHSVNHEPNHKRQIIKSYETSPFLLQIEQAIGRLDHIKHIHLNDNECFLDFQSFREVLEILGYTNFGDKKP